MRPLNQPSLACNYLRMRKRRKDSEQIKNQPLVAVECGRTADGKPIYTVKKAKSRG